MPEWTRPITHPESSCCTKVFFQLKCFCFFAAGCAKSTGWRGAKSSLWPLQLFSSQNRVRTLVNLGWRRHRMMNSAAAASVIPASPLLCPPAPHTLCLLPPWYLSPQSWCFGLESCDKIFRMFCLKMQRRKHHTQGIIRELAVRASFSNGLFYNVFFFSFNTIVSNIFLQPRTCC